MTKRKSAIYATKGLPGSGKSTWALNRLNETHLAGGEIQRINNDSIRLMLCGENYRPSIEPVVGAIRRAALVECLRRGEDVIVDNCNLGRKASEEIERLAREHGAEVTWIDFTGVPIDVCIERDAKRPNPVGAKVIRKMARGTLGVSRGTPTSPYRPEDYGGPNGVAVICDIDGTLALHVARGPYDMERCETDALSPVPDEIVWLMRTRSGAKVYLVSGREEIYRQHTERWLERQGVAYDGLFMRPSGDKRRDDIVKEELFREHIAPLGHFIRFVLDDRDRVVDMWRNRLGLTCLQVAEGDF